MSTSQTQAPTLGNATRHRVDSVHELVDRRNVGKSRFSYEKEKKRESNQELMVARARVVCVYGKKKRVGGRSACLYYICAWEMHGATSMLYVRSRSVIRDLHALTQPYLT